MEEILWKLNSKKRKMTDSNPAIKKSDIQNIESVDNMPPLTPLALRIGVTGHRTESDDLPKEKRKRPIPNIPTIRASVREIFEVIRVSLKDVADTNGDLFDLSPSKYSQPGGGTLRIISALASGADQWVAEETIKLGFELQVVLPFLRGEYLKDFTVQSDAENFLKLLEKAKGIIEFDGKLDLDENGARKPDSQSYEAVGRGILNQTDLLIAVWDGKDSRGRGGTGQVVREALQNGIPVIWIPWDSPEKWQLHLSHWDPDQEPINSSGRNDSLSSLINRIVNSITKFNINI